VVINNLHFLDGTCRLQDYLCSLKTLDFQSLLSRVIDTLIKASVQQIRGTYTLTQSGLIAYLVAGVSFMQVKNEGRLVCRLCLIEGIINSQVIERVIRHPSHQNRYARMICATCWQQGRNTPATCKTFVYRDAEKR
jgi:hypothetical protein